MILSAQSGSEFSCCGEFLDGLRDEGDAGGKKKSRPGEGGAGRAKKGNGSEAKNSDAAGEQATVDGGVA